MKNQLQAILKYQEKDKELVAIEMELSSSQERKTYGQAKKFIASATERLDALDVRAKQLREEAGKLVKKYQEVEKAFAEFASTVNLEELQNAEISEVFFYKRKSHDLEVALKKVRADLTELMKAINEVSDEYQELKAKTIKVQKQGKEAKEKYAELEASKAEARDKIVEALNALAKDITPELMSAYLEKRKEKVFPVVGKLRDTMCPFCSMEPPLIAKSNLANGIECDHCHRIIFEK